MIDYEPSHLELLFWQTLSLIAAACLFTPLMKKLGLGTILGYLLAGIVVNLAYAGNFSEHPEELLHFSEFGVVLFLFVIGLELKPQTLWQMRSDIFGLGLAQMLGCGALLAIAGALFGIAPSAALIVGLGLALSSTAIVMTQLDERRERNTLHGRKSFSILLFQDLAIVPLLLLATLLAPTDESLSLADSATNVGVALVAIILLILAGRYLLSPMFSLLSKSGVPEIMTATALGIVIAAALLMDVAGMSYAMGSFIAGVMLAESSYRHEIEADIEPFRGLFLGLFFMAVGLSLDIQTILDNALIIVAAAPLAMTLKAIALYAITRLFGNEHNTSVRTALGLSQHGEFGFVLFAAAAGTGLLGAELTSILISIISVSMALSGLTDKLLPRMLRHQKGSDPEEDYSDAVGSILVIGFGRFGQIVSQPLFANGLQVITLDNDTRRIEDAQRFGFRVHFGDGSRREILRAAGIANVKAVVVATDDPQCNSRIVELVKKENPEAQIYVRSYDRLHSIELNALKADFSVRECFESALALSRQTLIGMGTDETLASRIITDIRHLDLDRLRQQVEDGIMAGIDKLHIKPVQPEPLKLD